MLGLNRPLGHEYLIPRGFCAAVKNLCCRVYAFFDGEQVILHELLGNMSGPNIKVGMTDVGRSGYAKNL